MQGGVSLIAGLEQTIAMEYLREENEAVLHYVRFLSFLILSDIRRPQKSLLIAGKAAS